MTEQFQASVPVEQPLSDYEAAHPAKVLVDLFENVKANKSISSGESQETRITDEWLVDQLFKYNCKNEGEENAVVDLLAAAMIAGAIHNPNEFQEARDLLIRSRLNPLIESFADTATSEDEESIAKTRGLINNLAERLEYHPREEVTPFAHAAMVDFCTEVMQEDDLSQVQRQVYAAGALYAWGVAGANSTTNAYMTSDTAQSLILAALK